MSEIEARPPSDQEPIQGVTAAATLAGLPMAGRSAAALERTRLSPIVAASLRSALDALLGDATSRRPLTVVSDDAVLDLRCPSIDPAGLRPAGAMLEMVDGQIGVTLERGTWAVRVPTVAGRSSFLMVEQGTLRLAVPWHSVARVRLVPMDMIESMARRQGYAVLPPIARAGEPAHERPAILIGHGLRRAWMVADRLVWRLPADRVLSPETPGRELGHAVQTDDGEVFWVVDPARLLRDVELPPLPDPAPRAPAPPPAPAVEAPPAPPRPRVIELRRPEVEPLEDEPAPELAAPPPAPDPAAPASAPDSASPPPIVAETVESMPMAEASFEVTSAGESVESAPILEEAAASGPIVSERREPEAVSVPAATPEAPPAPFEAPSAATPPAASGTPAARRRRALVAEDSITARIFLVRLLEQEGFEVRDVGTARELHTQLGRGPWSVVFVDVELPDAHGLDHLRAWTARPPAGRPPFPVVALVRDRADESMAEEAGIHERLRKPFERDVLIRLVESLGLAASP